MTMKQSSKNYMEYLRDYVFQEYNPSPLYGYPNTVLPQHEGKTITQYHFSTKTSIVFTAFHSMWYVWDNTRNKFRKIVPLCVAELFTRDTLLHWIIQDGYFDNGRAQTLVFCTESFTKEECVLLQDVLMSYDISSSLKVRDKKINSYRIRISKRSMAIVRALVENDMPLQYRYKLGTNN